MKHKIGILGFGTVGQGLAEILLKKKEELKQQFGFEWEVTAIAGSRYGTVYNPGGLDLEKLLGDARSGKQFSSNRVDWDNQKLISQSETDIWCELTYTNLTTGGAGLQHVKAALESGKHVVSCNKGPAALFYRELENLAKKNHVLFLNEGTVVAGTPVLNLANGPLAGCSISKIEGILNGTTNYILTLMEQGVDFNDALAKAQQLGYAEADPTGDVEGYDAQAKIAILAHAVMRTPVQLKSVACQGISKITLNDINKAAKAGKRWKLIGSVEMGVNGVSASVGPRMLALENPLAGVEGTKNALTFTTDLLGEVTIVGPGAGKIETGFAVLSDLLHIHREKL